MRAILCAIIDLMGPVVFYLGAVEVLGVGRRLAGADHRFGHFVAIVDVTMLALALFFHIDASLVSSTVSTFTAHK